MQDTATDEPNDHWPTPGQRLIMSGTGVVLTLINSCQNLPELQRTTSTLQGSEKTQAYIKFGESAASACIAGVAVAYAVISVRRMIKAFNTLKF